MPAFANLHPYQPIDQVQGMLELLYTLREFLQEISGLAEVSLHPAAGAHGEMASLMMITAYHRDRGEKRPNVLIPDTAHGTNPASCAMCARHTHTVSSCKDGKVDLDDLRGKVDEQTAALMITNPNTVGVFDDQIGDIAEILHKHGALLYLDGANMNAMLGITRPADFGVDVMHFNTHKTFSTPHGGGGPGAGPIAVKAHLAPFLPTPHVRQNGGGFVLTAPERSIGRLGSFHGNFGVLVRAYAYILSLGADGLRSISEAAVINANYVLARLRDAYRLPYDRRCMHEVVFSGSRQKAKGVKTLDIAKRLIDYGFHPPTIYFPLIVDKAIMIEPTESESKESVDAFCDAMLKIAQEVEQSPELVRDAPHNAPLRRLDEATAARKPVLRWRKAD